MISREIVEQRLRAALNRYAGIPEPVLLTGDTLKNIDSLTKVEIILALEDEFKTHVPEDEVDGWDMHEIIEFFVKEGNVCTGN